MLSKHQPVAGCVHPFLRYTSRAALSPPSRQNARQAPAGAGVPATMLLPHVRTLRALDALFYALLAETLLLGHPWLGRNHLGVPGAVCALPLFLAAWGCWRLPPEYRAGKVWGPTVRRLRLLALAAAATAPLGFLWFSFRFNLYFLANLVVTAFLGVAALFHLALLLAELAAEVQYPALQREGVLLKYLLFYLVLVPLIAITASVSLECRTQGVHPVEAVDALGNVLALGLGDRRPAIRMGTQLGVLALLLPFLMSLTLLFRVRRALARHLEALPA